MCAIGEAKLAAHPCPRRLQCRFAYFRSDTCYSWPRACDPFPSLMKRIALLLLPLLLLCAQLAHAQQRTLTKAEKKRLTKEWKTKAKQFSKNPLALRDNQENFKKKLDDLTKENETLQEQLREAEAEVGKAQSSFAQMQSENQELRTAYEAQKNAAEKDVRPGLIFKVQIGAFQYFDMSKYLKSTSNFEGESADNLNRYTVGNFRDMVMAEAFKKDLRKMGIRDAWIVPFRDGVRIQLREAKKMLEEGTTSGN